MQLGAPRDAMSVAGCPRFAPGRPNFVAVRPDFVSERPSRRGAARWRASRRGCGCMIGTGSP